MARSGPDRGIVALEPERERTIELLKEHFAQDNLSLDELERRLELVFHANSLQALRELTRDLPTEEAAVIARPAAPLPPAFAPERGRISSIMGTTRRRGVWQVPKELRVLSLMSDTYLDLTEAQFQPGVTEIRVRAIMTSLKIIVAPGVRVVFQPTAFMADAADETTNPPAVGSGAPVIRVTGSAFMAEVKVFTRTREQLSASSGVDKEDF